MTKSIMHLVLLFAMGSSTNSYSYEEDWNQSSATNNFWYYRTTSGQQDMQWHSSGGVGDTPHVSSPLGDWYVSGQSYFLAYTYGHENVPNQTGHTPHPINLAADYSLVSISLRFFIDPEGGLGSTAPETGQAGFWIGERDELGRTTIFTFNSPLN